MLDNTYVFYSKQIKLMPFVALHFPSEIDKKYLNVIIDKYLFKTTNPV